LDVGGGGERDREREKREREIDREREVGYKKNKLYTIYRLAN
jgi:hypothetical protein